MVISHQHRFIFVKTKKSAGTSIEILLSNLAGADAVVTPTTPPEAGHEPRNWRRWFNPIPEARWMLAGHGPVPASHGLRRLARDLRARRAFYSHMALDVARLRCAAACAGYYTFCFERNPWDKAVSHYFWQRSRLSLRGAFPTFDEWIQAGNLRSDWRLYARRDEILVDTVGRYENLSRDLAEILTRLGLPADLGVPAAKTGRRPSQLDFQLSRRAGELVERTFAREISAFGYRRPDWW